MKKSRQKLLNIIRLIQLNRGNGNTTALIEGARTIVLDNHLVQNAAIAAVESFEQEIEFYKYKEHLVKAISEFEHPNQLSAFIDDIFEQNRMSKRHGISFVDMRLELKHKKY